MNLHYINRYNRYIDSLKGQVVSGYSEKHHILPKAFGGSDDATNLIELTARQHFVAHWILSRAHGGKMANAFWLMVHATKKNSRYDGFVLSRVYEEARKMHSESQKGRVVSEETKLLVSQFHTGRKRSEETCKRISDGSKGKQFSETHRENLKLAQIGKKQSEETKNKRLVSLIDKRKENSAKAQLTLSAKSEEEKKLIRQKQAESMKGRKHTEEAKAKMRAAKLINKTKILESDGSSGN